VGDCQTAADQSLGAVARQPAAAGKKDDCWTAAPAALRLRYRCCCACGSRGVARPAQGRCRCPSSERPCRPPAARPASRAPPPRHATSAASRAAPFQRLWRSLDGQQRPRGGRCGHRAQLRPPHPHPSSKVGPSRHRHRHRRRTSPRGCLAPMACACARARARAHAALLLHLGGMPQQVGWHFRHNAPCPNCAKSCRRCRRCRRCWWTWSHRHPSAHHPSAHQCQWGGCQQQHARLEGGGPVIAIVLVPWNACNGGEGQLHAVRACAHACSRQSATLLNPETHPMRISSHHALHLLSTSRPAVLLCQSAIINQPAVGGSLAYWERRSSGKGGSW